MSYLRRAWVWLFGAEGYGFVELVVVLFAGFIVLVFAGILIGLVVLFWLT